MSPDAPAAQALASMACTGFELGGGPDDVAGDILAMWEHLGRPAGAFEAASVAVGALPQRPEVPLAEQPRRRAMERAFGIHPVEVELAAALAARELLQLLAGSTGAR